MSMVSTKLSAFTCPYRAYSRLAPSQWEMSLQSNTVSHWLGANLEPALPNSPHTEAWTKVLKHWPHHKGSTNPILISHNVPFPDPTIHHSEQKCAHFCSEWWIVGFGTGALWDLWDWFIIQVLAMIDCYTFTFLLPWPVESAVWCVKQVDCLSLIDAVIVKCCHRQGSN